MHQMATNPLHRMIEEGTASAANTQQYFCLGGCYSKFLSSFEFILEQIQDTRNCDF